MNNGTLQQTVGPVAPLKMFQPFNIIVLLVMYSTLIVSMGVLSMSFIFQNFKGFICLAFIIASVLLREFIIMISGHQPLKTGIAVCDSVEFSKYGNAGISIFVLSFVLAYISLPMFLNGDVNYWIFGGLLVYLFVDILVRSIKGCLTTANAIQVVMINLLSGLGLGIIIPSLLYAGGSSKYLFFNEVSSSKEVCSMPKKQQFKCAVYKNGELIGST
jgi:hypothetical protein